MAIDLLVERFEAPLNTLKPTINLLESPIDLVEPPVHLVPRVDDQVPKVGYRVHPGLEGCESFFYCRHVGASWRAVTARF